MRRVQLLITQVQRATENERAGANDGISLEEYYQYFTDGQRFIQSRIIGNGSNRFRTSTTWSADGAEARALPFDVLSPEKIATLEYSSSGNERDYCRLKKRTQLERWSDTGVPGIYILQGQTILVNAYPSGGSFRLTYQKRLPTLDKRRGVVGSRAIGATALTALTITPSGEFDQDDYSLADHICVVGWDGTMRMRGIPYTAVSAAGVVSVLSSSYTFPTGSTAPVGDYVALGEYATSHVQLDDDCESTLLLYVQKRILFRDASDQALAEDAQMKEALAELLTNYEPEDIDEVPTVNNTDWDVD